MALETETAAWAFAQAAALLPNFMRLAAEALPLETRVSAEELRLRVGQSLTISSPAGECVVPACATRRIHAAELSLVLEIASCASVHAVMDEIKNGFLTVEGGHRLGLCGSVVLKDGAAQNFHALSSINIRIAKQVQGAASTVLPRLYECGVLQNTLILSPPGMGKTTLLRDLVRGISNGAVAPSLRVGLADARGEVAALQGGMPQLDVGRATDVMGGCPKALALTMLLRSMNPQVLAADEITAAEDLAALEQSRGCGVTLLATAHGGGICDLEQRALYRGLLAENIFQKVVLIRMEHGARVYEVQNLGGEAP